MVADGILIPYTKVEYGTRIIDEKSQQLCIGLGQTVMLVQCWWHHRALRSDSFGMLAWVR